MDFLSNPNLNNVAALSTTSTKVLVVDGASNTVKYRTPAQIITDGGGSGSSSKEFQATLLGGMPNSNDAIYMADNGGGWGWPDSGSLTQADSLLKASKFVVPFKPANYRFSALCYSAPTYWVGTTPTAGDFGIKFQYSANNSTWTDIDTLFLKGKAVGDIASANGTLSIGGTDTLFYIRVVFVNTLSSQASGVNMQLTTLVANFWN